MKAVVTGGAGFIGSHLVDELLAQHYEVHVLDNLSSGKIDYMHPEATFHQVDICDEQVKSLIASIRPDVVFHLAAQADVQRSIANPGQDAYINLIGTIHLLEAARDAGVNKFIFASTSAVYGNLQKERLVETDAASPISYYGLSKFAAESYIRVFHHLYGLPYTILRFGNVYGPRQTAKGEGGVVAVFMDRILQDTTLTIHGDGEQTRDFVYVKDVVRAIQKSIPRGSQETLHISTGQSTSIKELAQILSEFHGSRLPIRHTSARQGDIKHSCLANEKAAECLEWQPLDDMRSGLLKTYRSYMRSD
ncbi:GDP-mannose 4,6-dehydratase [Paenibacillus sp. HWE-109]|uniref:NAD-dependent epimerase/dehydratase family protein n=1 Tax=Paenibacillus sp. HWE-109 TaxID=1306526 RepID=UPI001EDF7985|nr:NAD-dependent epimerase/dehydratase family protein [Paenibacillus sp. HWE-109]UKS27641.1 GDP-mannose 4,6-dehydratase [Paenibacillus sp. HWE-109]